MQRRFVGAGCSSRTGVLLGLAVLLSVPAIRPAYAADDNLLVNGSFETWHAVSGQDWGTAEPDGWHGWEIYPWTPPGYHSPNHITIQMDRPTGIPNPLVKDGLHRVGMDEGWRSCYGGVYQEITGLSPVNHALSGWVAWSFQGISRIDAHFVEVLVKDGPHTAGAAPTGTAVFRQNGSVSNLNWSHFEGTVGCATGTLTVYANLRSDDSDGASFAHFDGFQLVAVSVVRFSNFQWSRVISGAAYDVTVSYDTELAATTQVEWGPTTAYGSSTPLDSNEVTHHVVQLNGVAPAPSPYHYRAHATATGGVDEYSSDLTFDAPLITFSDISATPDFEQSTICTVTWSTNFATTMNKVFYRVAGTGPYAEAVDPLDPDPRTSHTVTLAGLALNTTYEYYLQGSADEMFPGTSSVQSYTTPAHAGVPIEIGMSMIGRDLAAGGDDVGPAQQVQDMLQRDHPVVTVCGMPRTSWAVAQPEDPGDGPDVYDWSALDAQADKLIPGKSLTSYYQMYGTSPAWADREADEDRFWQKFEAFIEAMTVHMNEQWGPVNYTFENEPNTSRAPDGWNWAVWYIYCLQHFHPAVHRADARTGMQNAVTAGNLYGHSANAFTDLYARGLKSCSDVLGYHPYPYDLRDGLEVADLARIHEIQVQYGDGDKKIRVTEGWGSGRSAGFDRSSPLIEPPAAEVENMWLAMVNGWDNVMTPRENWHPSYLWGMHFFCGNDNWGARNWRSRAITQKDVNGNVTGFLVDGYWMTPDIAPQFWNGGMLDFYGNSKDCLSHVFPGDGLVFMNPGFELASDPPNAHLPHFWTSQADPASLDNYTLDDGVFRGGSRSLKLTQTTDEGHGVWQLTAKRSATGLESYRARVWCKTEDTSGLTARFYMRFCDLDGTVKSEPYWAADVTGTSNWQLMEVVAAAPPYAKRIEVGCLINGVGTAWFDDVTIAPSAEAEVGTVRGYTLDENQVVVPYCLVKTTTGGWQAVSDETGYYEMQGVPTGTYDFVCRGAGYVPHRVKNQTVAAGKLTFVSFNMGIPKPGLTITQVACDRDVALPGGNPANVTVTVANGKPYPNNIAQVDLFVEQGGADVTERFWIAPSQSNPRMIPENSQADFMFTLTPRAEADGQSFEINAYAFGQEDRPDMLKNGGLDREPWNNMWYFSGAADSISWQPDETDYVSAPRSLVCQISDNGEPRTYNWANNKSAQDRNAVEAYPARNYTVGVHHKDNLVGSVSVNLFIQEYYYDGEAWFYNGRRFISIPRRSVWAHDVLMYDTGDPNVTEGLYPTNRLLISCGLCTSPPDASSGRAWYDDLYVKETGDWLADERADAGAALSVQVPQVAPDFNGDGDVDESDLDHFNGCATGPAIPQPDPDCADADLDEDSDVDQSDFGILQRCLSGSGNAADPACAD